MRPRAKRLSVILCTAFATVVLHAGSTNADPVSLTDFFGPNPTSFNILSSGINGTGAPTVTEILDITFANSVLVHLFNVAHLSPAFCRADCVNGTPVSFTQTTGDFSGRAFVASSFLDVSGTISFVGPTDVLNFPSDFSSFQTFPKVIEPIQVSGLLTIARGPQVLFNDKFAGSGTGTVEYFNTLFATGTSRLEEYDFSADAVSATPEPGSIVLVGTGLVWLATKRRRRSGDPSA
jgi:hypothetical protein